jgi:putative two-component system response regulator
MHTILVIDDEKGAQEAIKCVLRARYRILIADNAASALEILARSPVDLITLDLRLPDGSGIEILRTIRQTHLGTPIVIVTGYGTLGSADEAFQYGAVGYLLKPFNTVDLSSVIQQALRQGNAPIKSQLSLPLNWRTD